MVELKGVLVVVESGCAKFFAVLRVHINFKRFYKSWIYPCWLLPSGLKRSSRPLHLHHHHGDVDGVTPSRPTLGLELYEFYLNLLSFSVFLLSFLL